MFAPFGGAVHPSTGRDVSIRRVSVMFSQPNGCRVKIVRLKLTAPFAGSVVS